MGVREQRLVLVLTGFVLFFSLLALAQPQAVPDSNVTQGPATTRSDGGFTPSLPRGGNASGVNVSTQTQTGFWQGVYGSIDVAIILQDAAGNNFYNWSRFNVTLGEIYFTNNSVIFFDGSINNASQANLNHAQTVYNWANSSGVDNLTNTYSYENAHQAFSFETVDRITITINASTTPALNLGGGLTNTTMLWDTDDGGYPLFVALIEPDVNTFTGLDADFEILLPVRGHKAIETYYMYAEVQ